MIKGQVVMRNGADGFSTVRMPAIVQSASGDLLMAFEGISAASTTTVLITRSRDFGITWEKPIPLSGLIVGETSALRGTPAFVVDYVTGRLFLMTSLHIQYRENFDSHSSLHDAETLQIDLLESGDDGYSWQQRSVTTEITGVHPWKAHGSLPGHGYQLRWGQFTSRLIMPIMVGNADGTFSFVAVCSDDEGQRWWAGQALTSPEVSCSINELPDGRLLLSTRAGFDTTAATRAYSSDGGRTWMQVSHTPKDENEIISDAYEPLFPGAAPSSPQAQVFAHPVLRRDPEGKLTGHLQVSLDGMQTWCETVQVTTTSALWPDMVPLPQVGMLVGMSSTPRGLESRLIPYADLGIPELTEMTRGWLGHVEAQARFLAQHGLDTAPGRLVEED